MKTTYSTKTGAITIKLSNLERRQLLGTHDTEAGRIIKEAIDQVMTDTPPANGGKVRA